MAAGRAFCKTKPLGNVTSSELGRRSISSRFDFIDKEKVRRRGESPFMERNLAGSDFSDTITGDNEILVVVIPLNGFGACCTADECVVEIC